MIESDLNQLNIKNADDGVLQSQRAAFTMFDILARGQLVSQGISIVAKLRIADYLNDGARSVADLASSTKVHPESLYRLLRMLASIGIFHETTSKTEAEEEHNGMRRFELTPAASLLLSETKNSIRDFALLFGLDSFNKATSNLLHTIQTGENSFKHTNDVELFEYLQQSQNQNESQIFNDAMASLTSLQLSIIYSLYDFSRSVERMRIIAIMGFKLSGGWLSSFTSSQPPDSG